MWKRSISMLLVLLLMGGLWPAMTPKASAASVKLSDIIYENGNFVAAGENRAIRISSDGVHWTEHTSATISSIYGIGYGNGLYVAVGYGGSMATSLNGHAWNKQESGISNNLNEVTYGENKYVTVGNDGTILTSEDGITWTPRTSGTTAHLNAIAYGNGTFVAVGGDGTVVTSDDGVNWTPKSAVGGFLTDVVYGDNGFVLVGFNGVISHSVDGNSWAFQDSLAFDASSFLYGITFGDGMYVVVGGNGIALTSGDGMTWESRSTGVSDKINAAVYGGGIFVLAGDTGLHVFGDGQNWSYPASGTSQDLFNIVYGNEIFVASGNSGTLFTSTDGVNWTKRSSSALDIHHGSTYGNGRFVLVGRSGLIKTSMNGTDWTVVTGVTDHLYGVEYGNGTYVAIGVGGRILTSTNGTNWTSQTSGTTADLRAVRYGGGQFVVVGVNGTLLTSPNGVNWTSRNSGTENTLLSVAYGNGKFVATGVAGGVSTSSDGGENWSTKTIMQHHLKSIIFANGGFLTAGQYGNIFSSVDGLTWSDRRGALSLFFNGIAYGSGMYVGVGDGGNIAQYSNTDLAALMVSEGTLEPALGNGKTRYVINVAHEVGSLTITATTLEPASRLQVDGIGTANGTESAAIALDEGMNEVEVVVTAPNGKKQTYKLIVYRAVAPPVTYTVTFDSQGGNAVPSATGVSAGAKIAEPGDPARAGYTFEGWYKEAGHATLWNFGTDTVSENLTLFAKWEPIPTYTVTFDSQGGSAVPSATGVSAGAKIVDPGDPARAGYTFEGWYKEVGHATLWNFGTDTVSENLTLFAKWRVISSGGGVPAVPDYSKVVSGNGDITLPAGRPGEVSLPGDRITVEIPPGATDANLRMTIETLLDTDELLEIGEVSLSQVFEVLTNIPGNFKKSIKLTLGFDLDKLSGGQRAAIFYYDEEKRQWVEVGGIVSGRFITVEVNHLAKYAVLAVGEPAKPDVEFSDIADHWAVEAIRQGVRDGITSGYPDGTFRPNVTVTRVEFVVMLMNAIKPAGTEANLNFTDAAEIPSWARSSVDQAVLAGIITGYSDGTFRSNAGITRAEMAVMIAKALGLKVESAATGFSDDESIPAWARGAVAKLEARGLMQGVGGNRFNPAGHATRAHAITILTAMADVSQ